MTTETQLIGKMYYKNFIINSESNQPVQILSELYLSEKDKETFNLSEIRFAQGEVYFHNKDFEAAIFKWEKVNHDLEPWAKKNIADAYFELSQYSKAENIYNTTKTENITLNTEVALQLFSLYIEQGKLSDAFKIIKKGVALNPDYPNITKIARTFYEEQQDWSSALELVIQEATRKESKSWFDTLKMYVDNGYTKGIAPNYFISALETLYQVDQVRFEQTAISLWNSYRVQECYLEWLQTFNNLFIHVEITRPDVWQELSNHYHEAYLEIINGKYFMNELSKVIPNLLTIWFKISSSTQKLFTSAAVLAWNEVFPQSISANVVTEAKEQICHVKNRHSGLDDSFKLLEQILSWAQKKDLILDQELHKKLAEFIHSDVVIHNQDDEQNAKLLIFIRKTIMNLLDKRVEAENELLSTIEWKESIVTKLNGAINQLKDNEKEKAEAIIKNYHDAKTEIKKDIITMIPTIIKNCADIISEESDFRQIHVELNEEMNSRVHNYLEETILPKFYLSIQDWIVHSTEQLQQSSVFLMEMNESFHTLLGDERLNLECDFHVLNDWQRDAERLTSRIQIAKENILLRLTPAQLLLKGAGKLFGAISQNKSLLSMRYKKYIENEDFYDVAVSITNQFLLQFDLFENALERDIEIFFRKPFHILDELIAKMRIEIIENEDLLNKMKEQPEVYLDPLAIFEVRLRQFELIMNVKQKNSPYPYLEYAKKMVQK